MTMLDHECNVSWVLFCLIILISFNISHYFDFFLYMNFNLKPMQCRSSWELLCFFRIEVLIMYPVQHLFLQNFRSGSPSNLSIIYSKTQQSFCSCYQDEVRHRQAKQDLHLASIWEIFVLCDKMFPIRLTGYQQRGLYALLYN